jgi:hypothetical protein
MDTDDETGGKNGEKGGRNEAEGENVNVVLPTGGSDDLDGNRTQREAVGCTDAIEGFHDSVTGQDLMETGWSVKNLDLGVMETTGNNTGTTAQYDGEPTESDVIYNLDGSVGFRDRSLGGKFVLVGGGRRKLEVSGNSRAQMGNSTVTAATTAKADTNTATNKAHEANQKAIMDSVLREKGRFELEKRQLGIKPTISLAAQISKGEVGLSSIGKLSMLGQPKAIAEKVQNVKPGARTIQTGAIRDATAANSRQSAKVHNNIANGTGSKNSARIGGKGGGSSFRSSDKDDGSGKVCSSKSNNRVDIANGNNQHGKTNSRIVYNIRTRNNAYSQLRFGTTIKRIRNER